MTCAFVQTLILLSYMHATNEKVGPILNKEDVNHLFGKIAGCLLSLVQDLILELWARCMAMGSLAATLVACHHLIVLHTVCLFLFPIRIWARLVACLILATSRVAQHMVR